MAGARRTWDASRTLALIGVFSVMLSVPLAVLGDASGPYDDPKAWTLLILATMTGLAWFLGRDTGSPDAPSRPDVASRVIRLVVLVGLSWTVLTTVTSVAPMQSLLGTFGRGMGLLTIGSATLLFFVIQSQCRTLHAARSLIDGALLGSVPVCLLAFGQALGWDPLPKPWDPAVRMLTVRSTFGTHIFLGSYLVVLIPLAMARLEWALRQRAASGGWPTSTRAQWRYAVAATVWVVGAVFLVASVSRSSLMWWVVIPWGIVGATMLALAARQDGAPIDSALTAWCLAGLLAIQVLIVILSRGRGAFLGMMVGLSVTAFAFLVRRRAWKTLGGSLLFLVGLVVFLVLLNLSDSPIASLGLSDLPLLSRLSEIADMTAQSPGWFRVQVWRGIADGWRRQLRGEETFPGLW
ncbi:MAG TPA: hypothetical protein VMS64_39060, partial [Candidatus Methylomirabilis sp.]|nr:hypothetical protein [Candidatus Methylomirabilis sp.]